MGRSAGTAVVVEAADGDRRRRRVPAAQADHATRQSQRRVGRDGVDPDDLTRVRGLDVAGLVHRVVVDRVRAVGQRREVVDVEHREWSAVHADERLVESGAAELVQTGQHDERTSGVPAEAADDYGPLPKGAADTTWNPNVNERVHALALSGTNMLVGGQFTSAGATNVERANLARLEANETLDATWNPGTTNTVTALAMDGDSVFVGGAFSGPGSIGGVSRDYIAKVSTAGAGAVDATWNPVADSGVEALLASGGSVFAGGTFSSIGGQSRDRVAKLSTTGTGAADATWNPGAGGSGAVRTFALSGSSLFMGGSFTGGNVGGQPRNYLAKVSTSGSGAADPAWNPNPGDTVWTLLQSGSDLYAGGSFTGTVGGQSRNRLVKLSTAGTGAADPAWNPNVLDASSTVYTLALKGPDLYVGGDFSGASSIPPLTRNYLARVSAAGSGGVDFGWNPDPNDQVTSMLVSGNRLIVMGVGEANALVTSAEQSAGLPSARRRPTASPSSGPTRAARPSRSPRR